MLLLFRDDDDNDRGVYDDGGDRFALGILV